MGHPKNVKKASHGSGFGLNCLNSGPEALGEVIIKGMISGLIFCFKWLSFVMLTLISPAKTLDFETPAVTEQFSQPKFLEHSAELIDVLRTKSPQDIASLMKLSDKLSDLNVQRYHEWQLPFDQNNAKAALLAFKGDVYTGLEAETFAPQDFDFAQQHLAILSGLYGLLNPLDLIQAYRLEMGTKLDNERGKDLYAFWGNIITDALNERLAAMDNPQIVNLASNEYFKSVKLKQLNGEVITPVFKDEKAGKYKIISFYAKKARGMMAAYIMRNQIDTVEQLKEFNIAGYRYVAAESDGNTLVFKRAEKDLPDAK